METMGRKGQCMKCYQRTCSRSANNADAHSIYKYECRANQRLI
jgi:hypothetical protein